MRIYGSIYEDLSYEEWIGRGDSDLVAGVQHVDGHRGQGFLACRAIDIEACQRYGAAAAIVESTPQNPIGMLGRFPNRKVIKVNEKAKALGIHEGMEAIDAFALIA